MTTLAPGEPRDRRAVHQALAPGAPPRSLDACRSEAVATDLRVEALARRWEERKPLWVRFEESVSNPALTAKVTSELRRAMRALDHPWFHVVACRARFCRVDADDPRDHGKRNQIVRVIDDVVARDPWFTRRVHGRRQSGAVFFEVVEP